MIIQDISKIIELFYIAFLYIYNNWVLLVDDGDNSIEGSTIIFDMPGENQCILNSIAFTGSQQTYFTRISKTKKALFDYPDDMTVLLCYMLTQEKDIEKQTLLSQTFRGVDSSIDEDEILVNIKDDIDALVTVNSATKDNTKKNAVTRDVKLSIESYVSSKEELLKCISEIKKQYVKVNGQVKPKFINEMYIYYFDEPCLL